MLCVDEMSVGRCVRESRSGRWLWRRVGEAEGDGGYDETKAGIYSDAVGLTKDIGHDRLAAYRKKARRGCLLDLSADTRRVQI